VCPIQIGRSNEVEHLEEGAFTNPAFPVEGTIFSLNVRYMVPLVCQHRWLDTVKQSARHWPIVNIWFMVDTSSTYTWLTVKSLEALVGAENVRGEGASYRVSIQVCVLFFALKNICNYFPQLFTGPTQHN